MALLDVVQLFEQNKKLLGPKNVRLTLHFKQLFAN